MAVGAPAEWLMAVMWINFMLNMAYDFYTNEHISVVVKAAYDTGESPNTPEFEEKRGSPKAEDLEIDETPFLGNAEYPAKAWTSPADELHYDPVALGELAAVRGLV